jgi:alpha-D-xyloside xylohydrolase
MRKNAARKAVEVGLPLVRPLVMEWQDDENTWDIFDEFLYGDDFLVAPSLSYAKERDVYLPEGRWRELDTGKIYNVSRGGIHVKKAISVGEVAVYKREEF